MNKKQKHCAPPFCFIHKASAREGIETRWNELGK